MIKRRYFVRAKINDSNASFILETKSWLPRSDIMSLAKNESAPMLLTQNSNQVQIKSISRIKKMPKKIVEKVQPRRRLFECVSEEPRQAKPFEYWETTYDGQLQITYTKTHGKYKIWKEVYIDDKWITE